ncbi:MAG: glycosyltransferase [Methanoregula sp.]|jgi:glycosyltransferase involved in cell wall biosynthesis
MKFGIVSRVLPPSHSGQAIALYNLLKEIDGKKYCLISSYDYNNTDNAYDSCTNRLNSNYYHIPRVPIPRLSKILYYAGRKDHKTIINLFLKYRAFQIEGLLKKECCTIVIGCTVSIYDIYATYLASKKMGIPFFLYAFDDYFHQWLDPVLHKFAEEYGPSMLDGAKGIFVPNEFLKDYYYKHYQKQAIVIHNPVDLSAYENTCSSNPLKDEIGIKILYTGDIYEAHYDAFIDIIKAIKLINNPNIKLHIYTARSPTLLISKGIVGPVIYHNEVPLTKVPCIHKSADILYLPLAFSSEFAPEIVKTSSPGKMGEYLAAGKPILVHAPADSFISWYHKEKRCGLVIDTQDTETLAKGITRIITDNTFRTELCENARKQALSDFSIEHAKTLFLNSLSECKEKTA